VACNSIETACDDFPLNTFVVNSVNKDNKTSTQITTAPLARRTNHSSHGKYHGRDL